MRNLVIRLVINAVALSAAAWLLSGIRIAGGAWDLVVVAAVFGLVNALIKPLVTFLAFPLVLLTLGLLTLVINAGMLLLTAALTQRLEVDGFLAALLGSVVISVVSIAASQLLGDEKW